MRTYEAGSTGHEDVSFGFSHPSFALIIIQIKSLLKINFCIVMERLFLEEAEDNREMG